MTRRKWKEYWTEVKRVVVVGGEPVVKETTCCCADPGMTRRQCSATAGHKSPCGCFCHDTKRVN